MLLSFPIALNMSAFVELELELENSLFDTNITSSIALK